MLLRRTTLALAAASLIAGVSPVQAQSSEQASAFVKSLGTTLTGIINGPGSTEQKTAALTRVIDTHVDISGVARFVLGRFWRLATPQQQAEYETLFHKVLIASITSKIGDYEGVRFTIGRAISAPEGEVVSSTIVGPKKPSASVDWVVRQVDGSPKIVDVRAEGTSLRLTQRDDYYSFLVQHHDNVQALLDAMRRQTSENG